METNEMKRFKDILCVVNARKANVSALARAVGLAENNQASLTVVDVVERMPAGIGMPDGGPISKDLQAALVRSREALLMPLLEPYRKHVELRVKVLTGTPFLEIIREVLRNGHDLVIKSPEDPSWLDRLFGSDDMHLLRKCPCPVWLVKAGAPKSHRRILAALDVGDEEYTTAELGVRRAMNRQIMEMAGSMALAEFAELHLVHAWFAVGEGLMRGAFTDMPEEKICAYVEGVRQRHEQALERLVDELGGSLGAEAMGYLNPRKHLVKGLARKEIPALAKQINADLVVMGTVARVGIPGFFMGNTAESILSQLNCSVLAIKPPGFVTPVGLEE
jgi:nucleotide-binding universal stress UspA family protein